MIIRIIWFQWDSFDSKEQIFKKIKGVQNIIEKKYIKQKKQKFKNVSMIKLYIDIKKQI